MSRFYLAQNLKTTNDTNGNPRRLWAVYTADGSTVAMLDEGYGGRRVMLDCMSHDDYRDIRELPAVEITPAEYRRLLKAAHVSPARVTVGPAPYFTTGIDR
jgi:hypothetical protein